MRVVANPLIEKEVRDAIIDGITIAENYGRETKATLFISHAKFLQVLNSLYFLKYRKQFENQLKNQVFKELYDACQSSNNVFSCK